MACFLPTIIPHQMDTSGRTGPPPRCRPPDWWATGSVSPGKLPEVRGIEVGGGGGGECASFGDVSAFPTLGGQGMHFARTLPNTLLKNHATTHNPTYTIREPYLPSPFPPIGVRAAEDVLTIQILPACPGRPFRGKTTPGPTLAPHPRPSPVLWVSRASPKDPDRMTGADGACLGVLFRARWGPSTLPPTCNQPVRPSPPTHSLATSAAFPSPPTPTHPPFPYPTVPSRSCGRGQLGGRGQQVQQPTCGRGAASLESSCKVHEMI